MIGLSFAEAIFEKLQGKRVEVYTGSSSKTREYADFSYSTKEVVRGILKEASGDLIVLEVTGPEGATNLAYLNCWNVVAILEPKNKVSIVDIYGDEFDKQVK